MTRQGSRIAATAPQGCSRETALTATAIEAADIRSESQRVRHVERIRFQQHDSGRLNGHVRRGSTQCQRTLFVFRVELSITYGIAHERERSNFTLAQLLVDV